MFTTISITSVPVLDQEEALAFYRDTLGLEVGADVDMGFMRWLTVHAPGDPDHELLLEAPAPPAVSEEVAAQVRELTTKGAMGVVVLATPDCRATHRELLARGVEFTQEPVEQPYGIDCAIRDPFGNHIRIGQKAAVVREVTDADRAAWNPAGN